MACAVGVLVSMLAMGVGAWREAMGTMRADRAVVMSADLPSPNQSSLTKEVAATIHDLLGIRRNAKASRSPFLPSVCSCRRGPGGRRRSGLFRSSA